MQFRSLIMAPASLVLLTACDGGIGHEQVAAEFEKSCLAEFGKQGGPAHLTEPFCECSTNKVKEQKLGAMDMFDTEKMEAIGEECMLGLLEEQDAIVPDEGPEKP